MIEAYGLTKILGEGTLLHALLVVLNKCGDIVFANLPLLFAMGVAIGMAKKEKDVAALSGAIAFLIMHSAIGALLDLTGKATTLPDGSVTSVLGIQSLQMGVFGGILVGLGVAALHNRFYKIELPQVLSFFGGTRFVPIISAFWQTAVGGTAMVGGQLVEGAQNIFFAELANGNISHFSVEATRFMSGKFPLMIFGLPGAALAMYKCANPKKKKIVSSLLLSAALTSMITGITEPIEFTFLFVAPVLYAVHCVFAGLAYMFMHIFNVGVGMTFSGGLIDLTLFGIMQGNAKTNWIWVVIVGIVYFIVYYFLFSFLIKKFNFKTPGRDENEEEVKLYTRNDVNAKNSKENNQENGANIEDKISAMICKGLGGKKNISDVDCCATRLRCTVYKSDLVDDDLLKSTGASGVIRKGEGVQIIYGPKVTVIKSNLEDYLVTAPNIEETKNTPISNTEVKEKDNKKETKENSNFKEIAKFSSPVKGIAAPIEETPDEAFAGKMMGDGIMIMPEDSTVFAPCDGEVLFVFPSKHAVGIKTTDGFEILIHIGINTVELNGEGFEAFVASGDKVKKGDKLISFDIEYIKDKVPSMATPFIFTALNENQRVKLIKKGEVNALEDVLIIEENI